MATKATSLHAMIRARPWCGAVVLAAAVNVVLFAAYAWSHGGQVTTVRIEAHGQEFTVAIDGRERLRTQLPAPATGGVRIHAVNPRVEPPSLPGRGRIEAVRITSVDGAVLYESDSLKEPARRPDGANVPVLDLTGESWRDFALEIRYRHLLESDLEIRTNAGESVTVALRRFAHAGVSVTSTRALRDNQVAFADMEPARTGSAKAAVAMLLRPYPFALLVVLLTLGIAFLLLRMPSLTQPAELHVPPRLLQLTAGVVALFVALLTAFLLRVQMDGLAYVSDEVAYLYQAKLFASGRVSIETPQVPEAFSFAYTPFLIDYDGRWASFYPFGHPIVLAIGMMVGAPWLVPPVLAGVNVLLLFAIGRRAYGAWTGLLAAVFLATSPFVLLQASSYMSHTTALTYLLLCLLAALYATRRPLLAGIIAGAAFGLLFNTRPLVALTLLPPLAVLFAVEWVTSGQRRASSIFLGAFATAAIALLGAYLAYNWMITGSPLDSGYAASGDLGNTVGFEGQHSVANGISNEVTNVAALLVLLNGWPVWIGATFVFLPFMLGSRNRYDWFVLSAAFCIMAGGTLYFTTGFFYGPRYVFEAVPLLLLIAARGVVLLADTPRRIAPLIGAEPGADTRALAWTRGLAATAVIMLTAASFSVWLFSKPGRNELYATPASARGMKSIRVIDNRLLRVAERRDISNALVILNDCGFYRYCYLSVFPENAANLRGDVVWAYDAGDDEARLIAGYPCRNLYRADYAAGTIVAEGITPPSPGDSCD